MNNEDEKKVFWEMVFAAILFGALMAGAFWIQHKASSATPYFETDIKE